MYLEMIQLCILELLYVKFKHFMQKIQIEIKKFGAKLFIALAAILFLVPECNILDTIMSCGDSRLLLKNNAHTWFLNEPMQGTGSKRMLTSYWVRERLATWGSSTMAWDWTGQALEQTTIPQVSFFILP
jgi:hypothetical protein